MTARVELIERWQTQLAMSEGQARAAPIRLRWLWTMRVRLYRFLLDCYGNGEWNSSHVASEREPTRRPLVDNRPADGGQKPKSAERISATLYSVQCAVERKTPLGPLTAGLYKDEWIRVAIFKHRDEAIEFRRQLKASEIDSRITCEGSRLGVEVQRADFDRALAVNDECRAMFSSLRQQQAVSRYAARSVAWRSLFFIFGNLAYVVGVGALLGQVPGLPDETRNQIYISAGLGSLICLVLTTPFLFRIFSFRFRPHDGESSKAESE